MKDKDGTKHTDIAVELDEEDIIALSSKLFAQYKEEIASLREKKALCFESC